MLSVLCGEDAKKWDQAKLSAINSIGSRIKFWNNLSEEIDVLSQNIHNNKEINHELNVF
jgi:hypothetical protein